MIDYDIEIEAPVATVWEMLTDADRLTEWVAISAETDPRPGGVFRWVYENGDVVLGRFLELDPPWRLVLAYGWEVPADRGIPPESTVVEIRLDAVTGGTHLRLLHRGLPPAHIESHRHGWDYFLGRLAARLAGSPTAWGERDGG